MKHILLIVAFLGSFLTTIYAQRSLSGSVADEQGEPLIGVAVSVLGKNRGTVTNADGRFTIQVSARDVVKFSYLAMKDQEIIISDQAELEVVMESSDGSNLNEVVVVGYGVTRKKDNITSIATIKSDDLQKTPVASLDQALQGRAAGVQVTKGTGAPGGAVSIRIRGTGSINGNQEPLYVIDGVPINNTFSGSTTPAGAGANYGGFAGNEVINGMAGINMDDIESIEILKDAAAGSIYGARAANGVVLVTTKRGKEGRSQVNFSSYYGLQNMNRRYDLLNAQEFAAVVNEGLIRSGAPNAPFYRETPNNTNWQDEIFQTAPIFNSTISFSGGSKKTQYLASLSYFKQEGIVLNSGFDRFSYRTNVDHNVNNRLKLGTNIMFSYTINQRLRNSGGANVQDDFNGNAVFGPSVIASALVANPTLPVYFPNGTYAEDSLNAIRNPVALAQELDLKSFGIRAIGNVFAELEIVKGLRFRTNIGTDVRDENEEFFFGATPGVGNSGRLQRRSFRELIWLNENYFSYDLNIKRNRFNFLLGNSTQRSTNDGYTIGLGSVIGGQVSDFSASNDIQRPYSDGDNDWAIVSYFTRLKYDFDEKYYFSATVRSDGSSRFGPNRKYGFFPSASLGYRLNKDFNLGAINEFKLRVSYGLTGNDQIPPFGWRASAVQLPTRYIGQNGTIPLTIQNEDYSWESSGQFNAGVDISVWQDRLNFTVEYYNKRSYDLLLFIPLPKTTGFDAVLSNVGSMQNQGIEGLIDGTLIRRKNFRWNANFNIAFNRNKILKLVNGDDVTTGAYGYSNVAREGQEISFQLFQLEETVDPLTGNLRIKDLNGNGVRDDIQIVGSPLPDFFGGFTNNIYWKNWDCSVFFQGVYGNLIINNTRGFVQDVGKSQINRIGTNLSADALGRWVNEGDVATFPGIDYTNSDAVSQGALPASGVPTDQNLEDGSFLRLKNFQIGYTLPTKTAQKYRLNGLRLYLTANNLLTFTRYSGYDPEVNHNANTNVGIGFDEGTYPQFRSLLFGFNLTL
jgi:TonB-dependent starch-binding outer membrane protein SusC